MKIKPYHYGTLEMYMLRAIAKHPHSLNEYREAGLSDKRYRWDLLRATKLPITDGCNESRVNGITWICDNLYSYMNDDHIDTALRKITDTK